ncbi:MAG TPA: TetR/AcrR family transcriptional regulator [Casimicrobiaceae bacterium]|jgi:AcrR family transcriptional regulator|nr:TetR/AcrR family transcriptional regulator [Casimicrobiaceae bacterium]
MAERKRPRRTRERILETALLLFNRFGEPNVTTADIAGEMEISPGNLYYHIRNKDQIIAELFAIFEQQLDGLLTAPEGRRAGVEDLWLLLHLLFEAMWDYRFLFRDLDEILSRNRKLAARFALIMRRGSRTVIELCRGMVATGAMHASEREIAALAENVSLIATYWISYQKISAGERAAEAVSLDRAAYQVLSLIAPFLRGDAHRLLERLSQDYE